MLRLSFRRPTKPPSKPSPQVCNTGIGDSTCTGCLDHTHGKSHRVGGMWSFAAGAGASACTQCRPLFFLSPLTWEDLQAPCVLRCPGGRITRVCEAFLLGRVAHWPSQARLLIREAAVAGNLRVHLSKLSTSSSSSGARFRPDKKSLLCRIANDSPRE